MLSSIATFIWTSGPIMYSLFTILFLILIRMVSRAESCKKADKPNESDEKVIDVDKTAKSAKIELESTKLESAKTIKKPYSQLDMQFYGELFLSGLAAGTLVKYLW